MLMIAYQKTRVATLNQNEATTCTVLLPASAGSIAVVYLLIP